VFDTYASTSPVASFNMKKAAIAGRFLVYTALCAAFFIPTFVFASVGASQPLSSDDFVYRGVSSGGAYATSTSYTLTAGTVIYSVSAIFSPQNGATSSEVSVICIPGGNVAQWDFDLTLYSPTTLYLLSSSSPLGHPTGVTVATTGVCHTQFLTGSIYGQQLLPANIKTSGILHDAPVSVYNTDEPYFVLYVGSPVDGNTVVSPIPTLSSFASSSIASNCNQTGSGFFGSAAADFANGLCVAGAFLFGLPQDVVNQFATIPDTLKQKIPFSYVYEIYGIFSGLTASSTSNLAELVINFPAIGSTTPMGALVPARIVVLSTTTISTYLPDTRRQNLLDMQRVALWVGLAYMFYRRVVPHKATIHTT